MYQRLRYGRPIVIVSGLPRSGTSMMMRMLEAGGFPILTDAARPPDESNPHGYFELERVLTLDKPGGPDWLREARGRAIKVISALLPHLPETHSYQVVFMRRDLGQIVRSQNAMLARRSEPAGDAGDDAMIRIYERHLREVASFLARRRAFAVLDVEHRAVIDTPLDEARRVAAFVGRPLDPAAMAAAVDPSLHRNRA